MSSKKLPAMQFYPGDWLKDTRVLSTGAKGAWIEIMVAMWDTKERGVITADIKGYARLIGSTIDKAESYLNELEMYDVCDFKYLDDGFIELTCRRIVRDEEYRRKKAEAGRKGGKASSPKQSSKQKGSKDKSKAEAKRGSSTSSSTSSSITNSPPDAGASELAPALMYRKGKNYEPQQIDPPDDVDRVIDYGQQKGIPREACEMYYDMRATDNFHRTDREGNWKPILNWFHDLALLHKKGALSPDKQTNSNKNGKGNGNNRGSTKGDKHAAFLSR